MKDGSMRGQTCIITGAASGMGRIAARELAQMGATVIMNDRDVAAGQAARSEIIRLSGNDEVEFVACDMGEFGQVSSFAAHVLDNYPAIHVLINNAGLTNPEYILTSEGHEQHMAIMHLGHYLLIHLLLDRLRASAPARIVQISSDAHRAGPGIDFDDMDCAKLWKGRRYANLAAFQAYHRAKLAMVYATCELAERLAGTGVTVNAVSPGYFVGTNVFRHMRGIMKLGIRLVRPLLSDPERAARTHVFLASSPDVAGISGKYWEHCREKPTSPLAHDRTARARLIAFTEKAIRRWVPGGLSPLPR